MHAMRSMPAIFVPHGSPLFALQPGAAGAALSALAGSMGQPSAIVIVSPHWETRIPTVGSAGLLETIHDFSGFDPALYQIRYAAKGSEPHALEVATALRDAGFSIAIDPTRGLDHGAWIPLRHLYPETDTPIVPISIQHHGGPRHAHAIGRALAPLRARGYLIIGSGNITHNLSDWQLAMHDAHVDTSYVRTFSDWIQDQLSEERIEALLDYRSSQPAGVRAHPRDEHLLPLFTAMGAGGAGTLGKAFHRGISEQVLAMDGYVFESPFHS
ncbi:MAG: putative enzyme [Pseudomonadota bacterium]